MTVVGKRRRIPGRGPNGYGGIYEWDTTDGHTFRAIQVGSEPIWEILAWDITGYVQGCHLGVAEGLAGVRKFILEWKWEPIGE